MWNYCYFYTLITNTAKCAYAWLWTLFVIDNPGHDHPPWLSRPILCLLLFWMSCFLYLPYPGSGEVPECRAIMRCHSLCMGYIYLSNTQIYAALLYPLGCRHSTRILSFRLILIWVKTVNERVAGMRIVSDETDTRGLWWFSS